MATTYKLISSVTLSTTTASLSFTSIPATYTDLVVVWSGRTNKSDISDNADISFNGSTASFSGRYLEGSGSAVGGSGNYARFVGVDVAANATASTFSNNMVYITNYAGSGIKAFSADSVQENNATSAQITLNAGVWSNSAAITSIAITPSVGSFVQHSTAYLYGISNA
jgi:hypothetical protein